MTRDVDADCAGRYLCGAIHPDGAFLGVGDSLGTLRIFDTKTNSVITKLSDDKDGEVTAVAFNENGYWAAIAKGTAVQVRTHFACQ